MGPADYVHRYKDSDGRFRYVVAELRAGVYRARTNEIVFGETGVREIVGSLTYILPYTLWYVRRSDALRRARQVYGPEKG